MSNILTGAFTLVTMLAGQALNFSPETQLPWVREYKPERGVHMIKINNAPAFDIQPYVVEELTTAKALFKTKKRLQLVVNGGFFDPNNGKTISYVTKNQEIVLDPTENEALMENQELQPHLDKILNRGEFRVLKCGKTKTYDIAYHNDPIAEDCELIHSLQAGPILGKDMDLEKEYFVVKNDGVIVRDSISATKKVPRTAIGLKENDVYIFVVTDENPMTIDELSAFMQKKRMKKAIALDGGSSTSLEFGETSINSVSEQESDLTQVSETDDNLIVEEAIEQPIDTGRKVKSFVVIRKDDPLPGAR